MPSPHVSVRIPNDLKEFVSEWSGPSRSFYIRGLVAALIMKPRAAIMVSGPDHEKCGADTIPIVVGRADLRLWKKVAKGYSPRGSISHLITTALHYAAIGARGAARSAA